MPLITPTNKKDLKKAIYNAFLEQSKVEVADPITSYTALSLAIANVIDQYVATELYKIYIALLLPGAYTAPGNVSPSPGGPLTPGVIIASFAQVSEEDNEENVPQEFEDWKEREPIMTLYNNIGLQNEIFRAFNDRTSEPATGDAELAYRKLAETIGEGIAGYVNNELNKIKFALIQPGAFTAAAAVVNPGTIATYQPGVPLGPFV
jgi:hypothetical protein